MTGVDDDILRIPGAQALGDNLDNLGRGDHADFDGVGADIVKDGIDLRRDNIGGDVLHGGDAQGVLCGDGRDGRLCIQTVRRDSLDIGLNAGAAAGIAARDGKCSFHGFAPLSQVKKLVQHSNSIFAICNSTLLH